MRESLEKSASAVEILSLVPTSWENETLEGTRDEYGGRVKKSAEPK
jgi:hypothetical protein